MRIQTLLGTALLTALLATTACKKSEPLAIVTPCKVGDVIYASSSSNGEGAADVARAAAIQSARTGIARLGIGSPDGKGNVLLRTVEVPVVGRGKNGKPWALARVVSERAAGLEIASCSTAVTAHEGLAPADCPAWTGRAVWIDGQETFAVGFAAGSDEAAKARATTNAWLELGALGETAVSLAGKPVPSLAAVPTKEAAPEHEVEVAVCGGSTWVRLQVR